MDNNTKIKLINKILKNFWESSHTENAGFLLGILYAIDDVLTFDASDGDN